MGSILQFALEVIGLAMENHPRSKKKKKKPVRVSHKGFKSSGI